MAEARCSADWDAPAQLWALTAEIHRDAKRRSKPFTAADVHPFLKREEHKDLPLSEMAKEFERGR